MKPWIYLAIILVVGCLVTVSIFTLPLSGSAKSDDGTTPDRLFVGPSEYYEYTARTISQSTPTPGQNPTPPPSSPPTPTVELSQVKVTGMNWMSSGIVYNYPMLELTFSWNHNNYSYNPTPENPEYANTRVIAILSSTDYEKSTLAIKPLGGYWDVSTWETSSNTLDMDANYLDVPTYTIAFKQEGTVKLYFSFMDSMYQDKTGAQARLYASSQFTIDVSYYNGVMTAGPLTLDIPFEVLRERQLGSG